MSRKRLTRAALAEALGVSRRHVHMLQREGMPVDSVAAATKWRSQNIAGPADGSDVNRLRAGLIASRKRLVDLEFQERTRALIPAAETEEFFARIAQELRAALLQVAGQIRAQFPELPPAVLESIGKLHERALISLRDGAHRLVEPGQ